jgi:hypothetical protein
MKSPYKNITHITTKIENKQKFIQAVNTTIQKAKYKQTTQ